MISGEPHLAPFLFYLVLEGPTEVPVGGGVSCVREPLLHARVFD